MKKRQNDNFSYYICLFYTIELSVVELIDVSRFDILNT